MVSKKKKKQKRQSKIIKFALFIVGVFLITLNYNMFLIPNNLVIGGVSGIAIIIKRVFDINPVLFIYAINLILLIISFFFLGWKRTRRSAIGAILYPLFIFLTEPLALSLNFAFKSDIIMILVTGIIYGVGTGLVYKAGYTTGGTDILIHIFGEKKKVSTGNSMIIINSIIILFGGFFFGYEKVIYAIMILYIESIIVDRILLGVSDSKMFFVYTKKVLEVEKFIMEDIKTGVTVLNIEGGYSEEKSKMLMCVVRTRDYYLFKETILNIDPTAFLVINDCYEVMGGVKRSNLPFILTD